jgi:DNA-binding MarR family transcriptional regulator
VTATPPSSTRHPRRPQGAAFLLAQLGAHAAQRFGERLAPINLTPPDAGVIRRIGLSPGISQKELGEHLGIMPSRMVALVDNLQTTGVVERRRNRDDRRNYALELTWRGKQILADLARIAAEHEDDLCAALSEEERLQLRDLCRRIADQQGLKPGVHPGYRQLGKRKRKKTSTVRA